MKVLHKKPDEDAILMDMEDSIEGMRALIKGYVELNKINDELYILADEDGRQKNLALNWIVDFNFGVRTMMVGPLVLVGRNNDGQMCDLPRKYWEFFGVYREE